MNRSALLAVAVLVTFTTVPGSASAHCDTTRGPVITAAQAALDANDPNLVLHWVQPSDQAEITRTFQRTVAVRALGPEAKTLADRAFFETLVRVHRAGEGAPYTGIKDGEPEPIIAATDRALETGSSAELEQLLVSAVRTRLSESYAQVRAAKAFRPGDVDAGRAFVAGYVPFTHWVEGVYLAAQGSAAAHGSGAAAHGQAAAHGGGAAAHGEATAHGAPAHGAAEHAGAGHAAGGHSQHLPWLLVAGLGLVAIVEGGVLLRRRARRE